ncbi:MAG: hypothetical protein AAF206_18810 [Bacteroidota bacterium]
MRQSILFLLVFFSVSLGFAQYEAVVFDFEMGYFNNGQALPADQMMIFSGEITSDITAVEIRITKPNAKKSLYKGLWQRQAGHNSEAFRLPINYRLQGSNEYDIHLTYYGNLKVEEKRAVRRQILQQISFYRQQHIQIRKGRLHLMESAKKLNDDFNDILQIGLSDYRMAQDKELHFSPMLETYLKGLAKDSSATNAVQLDAILEQEIERLFDNDWWRIAQQRKVKDYPTEKTNGALALNVGYGGVLLSGDAENFTYGSAPYVGLSIPLSNRTSASPLLRNTSISLGAFTSNLEGPNEEIYTGPVFGRPFFAGLGYGIFRFIRLNAGVVVLEEVVEVDPDQMTNPIFSADRIQLQPFVGLSAEIRFSVGLNNR